MELQDQGNPAFNGDSADFTAACRWRRLADRLQPVRLEKVRSIRRAFRGAGYDTEAALEAAIVRLSEEVLPRIAIRDTS